jgi:hypothetical protein
MADELQLLSGITKGLSSFGEAASLYGASSGYESAASLGDVSSQGIIANAEFDARRQEEYGAKVIGTQRARYSKAGVNFSGSPAFIYADSEKNLRLDILVTKLNAANKANAIGFEALQNRLRAGQARTAAVSAIGKGILDIGTALALQGIGKPGKITAKTEGSVPLKQQIKYFGRGTGVHTYKR